jgi:hypothetical protein
MGIDEEIATIQRQFAEEQVATAQARAEARHERRVTVREKLRAGDVPEHFRLCATCIRAILTLDHDTACSEGKHNNLIQT